MCIEEAIAFTSPYSKGAGSAGEAAELFFSGIYRVSTALCCAFATSFDIKFLKYLDVFPPFVC